MNAEERGQNSTGQAVIAGATDRVTVPDGAMGFTPAYRRSALLLLMVIYIFNFVDRQVVNILAESIKRDLMLSDAQLGMITGLAFAVFYSLLGVPIARYAEHGDRPKIIAVAVGVWSAFTLLCGFATSFAMMLIARMGVGIGEAGGVPPTHSLITEFTPRDRRASAIAIYSMGLPLGSLVGLGLGGIIADRFGWRAAFFAAGVPGLIFALIALRVLREPRRDAARPPRDETLPLGQVLKILFGKTTYRWLLAGAAIQSIVSYGVGAFAAPFFLRVHGADLAQLAASAGLRSTGFLGLCLGLATGLSGAIGTFFGGWLADKLGRRDMRAYAMVPAICSLISVPAYLFAFNVHSTAIALLAMVIPGAVVSAWFGPVHATNQGLVAPKMRATVSAVTLVVVNLLGLGMGPPLIGMISDSVRRNAGLTDAAALQTALTIVAFGSLVAGWSFWRARRTIVTDTVS